MKLLLPLAILFVVFSFCSGKLTEYLGKKKSSPTPEAVSNSSSPATVKSSPEKLDDDALKSRLIEFEEKWKEAEIKGNRDDDEKLLADEFTNVDGQGKKYDKTEWLDVVKGGNPNIKSWKISDEKIEINTGDTAVMSLVVTYNYKDNTSVKTRDTDRFVYRDGRWQVVSSQSTVMK